MLSGLDVRAAYGHTNIFYKQLFEFKYPKMNISPKIQNRLFVRSLI